MGWRKIRRTTHHPEVIPNNMDTVPFAKKIAFRVRFGPQRSVIHPEKMATPIGAIREIPTNVLAQARSIPFSETRYRGNMVYIPNVPPIPKLKRAIMIQKEGSFKMTRRVLTLRTSLTKFPPLPKRRKKMPVRIERIPIPIKIPCQKNHLKSISTINGATTKPILGANSWIEMAFPQSLGLTNSVRVAIPEGR